ncbi:conserved hypothetical protein [Parvibaculum lavamentivorans DS-1]|uniref:NadR/Ttd14 AAA domain-containing protein n=1 Tax=Parvibaculum lavamentivorans (strain DS-1 / DSM 13023 / NCIMB 13966) TaxID=402881 RepID=A7HY67_PARL1|nr:AAA family ATPase [Parvibaculum lavamentivorans]ABS64850.1 conserved hypothetical protein [Parvibaculum lavamentivorans DS-1]
MKTYRPNFFVVTGGPGAGKTSLINALADYGHLHVEEAGRRIIREQKLSGGNATHDGDRVAYRELMFEHAIESYRRMTTETSVVFFDRGFPDLAGYSRLIGESVPPDIERAIALQRYNNLVFIAPPWKDIYAADTERRQDFAEGVTTHDAIRDAYQQAGYELIELPKASIESRVDFVLARANTL